MNDITHPDDQQPPDFAAAYPLSWPKKATPEAVASPGYNVEIFEDLKARGYNEAFAREVASRGYTPEHARSVAEHDRFVRGIYRKSGLSR